MLEKKDYALTYKMERRVLACRATDELVFDVEMDGNVLAVHSFSDHANPFRMLLASIQDTSMMQPQVDAHVGSLEHFFICDLSI